MKRRIAILFHEADRGHDLCGYSISALASLWRDDGHEVIPVFGTHEFVSAEKLGAYAADPPIHKNALKATHPRTAPKGRSTM